MEITKLGTDGFYLSSKMIDVAINSMNEKADVVLMSTRSEKPADMDVIMFDSPGEYEVKSCMIDAIEVGSDSCGFSVITEDIRVAYLGDIKTVLTDQQLEAFAAVDILILPVVGEKSEVTTKVINQIEPKVVIPHHYTEDQLKVLAAEFGSEQETVQKCKLSRKELTESEQQRLIVLE